MSAIGSKRVASTLELGSRKSCVLTPEQGPQTSVIYLGVRESVMGGKGVNG